jgi:hypothetical protein
MKKSIELDIDVIENIVVEELKDYYNLCNVPNKIDCSDDVIDPDQDLLQALDRVLQEYMTAHEYAEWQIELGLNKKL